MPLLCIHFSIVCNDPHDRHLFDRWSQYVHTQSDVLRNIDIGDSAATWMSIITATTIHWAGKIKD